MTNRTVQIKGYGFGATPASVTATVNGSQVFSGAVDTINEAIPPMPINPSLVNDGTTLFTFEIPMNYSGPLPMTVTVSNSPVVFAQILCNYANIASVEPANATANVNVFTSSGPTKFLEIYNPFPPQEITESRSNVVIDGMPIEITSEQRAAYTPPSDGSWWWTINPGSTMSCDINVTEGLE